MIYKVEEAFNASFARVDNFVRTGHVANCGIQRF
jgi:hypothetical protein